MVGAIRQQHATTALRQGGYAQLSTPLVMGLTAGAVVLATVTLVMVIT